MTFGDYNSNPESFTISSIGKTVYFLDRVWILGTADAAMMQHIKAWIQHLKKTHKASMGFTYPNHPTEYNFFAHPSGWVFLASKKGDNPTKRTAFKMF